MSNADRARQLRPFLPDVAYPTTRGELLNRGYLIDVSAFAERLGIILPVDVSLQLFADYLKHPWADVGVTQNIMNTLQVLQERILYEDAEDLVRFTMVYPIAGDYATVPLLGSLSATGREPPRRSTCGPIRQCPGTSSTRSSMALLPTP